jgi:hypothetical protein
MFTCPNCGALYQLVRAEGGPEAVQDEPTCGSCGSPFPARAGKFVLKYFRRIDFRIGIHLGDVV